MAVGSAAVLSGSASAATTRYGVSFSNVEDATDHGADPSGNSPSDAALNRAAGDDTLVTFPSGTYYFQDKNVFTGMSSLGIVGDGDVTFTYPSGFNEYAITTGDIGEFVFGNVTVDQTADKCTPGFALRARDDLQIHDVHYRGQQPAGSYNAGYALAPMVTSSSGTGVVENFTVDNGSQMGVYHQGNGRLGIWIGDEHKGTVTLRNCRIEGFSSNGVYASRTPGVVQVEGGVYRNNDVSNLRIGSEGSYVDGAVIEVDPSKSSSPNPEGMLTGHGIRLEEGRTNGGDVEVRNVDMRVAPGDYDPVPIVVWDDFGPLSVRNSRIQVDADLSKAIHVNGGGTQATIESVSITGGADAARAIQVDRSSAVVTNSCIQDGGQNGVFANGSNPTVRDSTINVPGQAIRGTNGSNISHSGSCPAPNLDDSSSSGREASSDEQAQSSNDQQLGNRLVVASPQASENITYSFTTSGPVEAGQMAEPNEVGGGSVAGGGRDDFRFGGEITKFEADGPAVVLVNGKDVSDQLVDASRQSNDQSSGGQPQSSGSSGPNKQSQGSKQDQQSDQEAPTNTDWKRITLTNAGSGVADYHFAVGGDIKSTVSSREDDVGDGEATGSVANWSDEFRVTGDVTQFDAPDSVRVRIDGKKVDPSTLGSSQSASNSKDRSASTETGETKTLTVTGNDTGSVVDYEFEVSGDVEQTRSSREDKTTNGAADGSVAKWSDQYVFTGEVTSFSSDAPLDVLVNGEKQDL